MTDLRACQAWRRLAREVIRQEPLCWLRLPGCTIRSTTADHVIPLSQRPDLLLVRSMVRGACRHCNETRGNKTIDQLKKQRREVPVLPHRKWIPASW
jgi:5-methylcytosine-specific restriction endonuclease McrA